MSTPDARRKTEPMASCGESAQVAPVFGTHKFSDQDLQVIAAFITAMADSAHQQVQNLEG
jgi:hypothetical protein